MSAFWENVEKLEHHKITINLTTRMHSSGMRTVRCSGRRGGGVYPSMHWAGGVYPSMHWVGGVSQHALGRGGVCPGVYVCPGRLCVPRGGVCPGGVCVSQHTLGRGVSTPVHAGIQPLP